MTKPIQPVETTEGPFGSDPKRSPASVIVLSVLYAGWFIFLLAMAIIQSARG